MPDAAGTSAPGASVGSLPPSSADAVGNGIGSGPLGVGSLDAPVGAGSVDAGLLLRPGAGRTTGLSISGATTIGSAAAADSGSIAARSRLDVRLELASDAGELRGIGAIEVRVVAARITGESCVVRGRAIDRRHLRSHDERGVGRIGQREPQVGAGPVGDLGPIAVLRAVACRAA